MKKIVYSLICLVMSVVLYSSHVYAQGFIYDIDEYVQDNGTLVFTDSFSDGLEPPSGPLSGSDYVVAGSFDTNRESTGLLELNSADGIINDDELVLFSTVDNSTYFFTDGSGGHVSGSFEMNDGLWNDSGLGLSIDNDAHSGPDPALFEDAFIAMQIDSAGTIFAVWGNSTWDSSMNEINNDFDQDITAIFGSNTKVTMELSLDASNQLTARWDFGSDGNFDLTKSNYANMDLNFGDYSGSFAAATVVPEPISSTLFIVGGATLGFRRFWKKRRN